MIPGRAMTAVLPIAAFLASLALTGFMRMYSERSGVMDIPNERSSHTVPTPRGGGLAIVLAFFACGGILVSAGLIPAGLGAAVMFGGGIAAALGLVDDHTGLRPGVRLVFHVTAAAISLWAMGLLGIDGPLGPFGPLLLILSLVWSLNLYNFMDGIDGLAASEAAFVGTSAALFLSGTDHGMALWVATLAAACLGFLVWNRPPARIFLGDVGSGFLGFTLGVIALGTWSRGDIPIEVWIILLGVFITDATFTLVRRIASGERWHEAHRSHAYQMASRMLKSHGRVTLACLAVNLLWLFPLAWLACAHEKWRTVILLAAYQPLLLASFLIRAQYKKRP